LLGTGSKSDRTYPISVMKASLCQRVGFAESAASGRTVLETDPQGLAAGEVRGVVAEILEMLDG
jgi:chromosome partitioning protein